MATLQDLPVLIAEFRDLAKEYLLQETVGQARKLGRFSGFSLGAAALWAAAMVLIGVAVMRGVVDALPNSPYWEALGYVIAFAVFVGIAAILVKAGPRPEPEEQTEQTGGRP
ncbi:MAG: hypothetical protein U9R51_01715 [Actinomycetota bacterium]|nr:hypothetical protein [Actinomycetota bacterium]